MVRKRSIQPEAFPRLYWHLQLSTDTSYRYNFQGWGLLVVTTVDGTGSGHRIAHALVSVEDAASIQFTISAVKLNFEWLQSQNITEF
jgi:hypothetical protein